VNDPTIAEPPAGPKPESLARSRVALVRTLRPHQWIKNLFVAAPLVFAQKLGAPDLVGRAGLAVLAFCALSGAVYAFNDVRDVEADRRHPTKRRRPVAAGELSERAALAGSAVLVAGTLSASVLLGWQFAALAAAYVVQNVAYTVWLKQVAFVDVALIAAGFLLRVLAGAVAIAVPVSGWLLLCTTLLALLLGFGKRAHELAWAERTGRPATRAALAGYRLDVLRIALLALTVATCGAFVAYTVDDVTIAHFGTDRLIYSAPLVALAVVRFLVLALWSSRDEPPTEAMLRDPWFLVLVSGAAGAMLYVIYW
jgi:decaprenyl-phosphate phosphoribosyltransferase